MLTQSEALAKGYTIDTAARIAYRGPRHAPTAVVPVFTQHEEELRRVLQAYESLWIERVALLGELSPELQAIRAQALRVLAR